MRSLVTRIKRLERRTRQQGPMRILAFDPEATTAEAALLNVGKPGRWLLTPSWSSTEAWQRALLKQQRELIGSAKRLPPPKPIEQPQVQQQAALNVAAPDVRYILKRYGRR